MRRKFDIGRQGHKNNKPPRRRTLQIAGAGLLLTCFGSGALAKEMDALLGMSLEQLMNVRVSVATLTPETLRRTPAAITVFNHDEIQRLGLDYLHELLSLVPENQMTRSSDGPFSVSSRGRATFTGTREILLLVDGVPRNDARGGGAHNALNYFPLERIERVEVIRGPGSALYGENAFTGVINVITRKDQNEAAAMAGSFERAHLHGLGNTQWNDWQVDGFVRAEQDAGDEYNVPASFGTSRVDLDDPVRNLDLGGAIANAYTHVSVDYQRRQRDNFYYGETLSDRDNEFLTDYLAVHVDQQLPWWSDVQSHVLLGWQQLNEETATQSSGPGVLYAISSPPSMAPFQAKNTARATVWEAYWKNDWSPSDRYGVQFGADWRQESDDESRAHANYDLAALANRQFPIASADGYDFETAFTGEDSRRVLGAYLQYQQQLFDPTRLTLSLRHDDYSDVDGRTSPRASLVHQVNDQHSLKLMYAEAFRAPTLLETGLRNNTRVIGNPDLGHEVVKTWDLLWLIDMDMSVFSLGWFHNHYIDPITLAQVGAIRTYVNGDTESSEGVELDGRWQPMASLQLRATFTRFTELPDSALREADTLGSLQMNYSHSLWNLNLAAVYNAERSMLTPTPGEELELDPYWLLYGKLLFELDDGVQWWLQAKNLLDEDYQTPAQGVRLTEGVPNRGLELALGILWRH